MVVVAVSFSKRAKGAAAAEVVFAGGGEGGDMGDMEVCVCGLGSGKDSQDKGGNWNELWLCG